MSGIYETPLLLAFKNPAFDPNLSSGILLDQSRGHLRLFKEIRQRHRGMCIHWSSIQTIKKF